MPVTSSEAVLAPAVAGEKVTCTVQAPPGASAAGQPVALTANSIALAPLTANAGTPEVWPPAFVRTKFCGALVVVVTTEPKSRDAGASVNRAGEMPVPETAAVVEPPVWLTARVADLRPPDIGAKLSTIVQVPDGARTTPWQPFEPATTVKFEGSVPPSAVPSAPVALPPVFVTVKTCVVLT